MKDTKYINGAEFGRRLGIGRSAVAQAIKRGDIVKEGKGINPFDPINLAYAEALEGRRERNAAVSLSKAVEKEHKNTDQHNELKDYNPQAVKAFSNSKDQQNILTKAKAGKAQIELAQLMGVLILRKDVEQFWGRVVGSLHTYIMPLDERLSGDVAAICEITAPEIVNQIKEKIQKELIDAMAQVQKSASEFSAILTSSS